MEKIIAMKDIRSDLSDIARRAEAGEEFIVMRSSKPVFRIVPVGQYGRIGEPRVSYGVMEKDHRQTDPVPALRDLQDRFEQSGASKDVTPRDLSRIIARVRAEKKKQGSSFE